MATETIPGRTLTPMPAAGDSLGGGPYCGPVPVPQTLVSAWTLEPALLAALGVAGLIGAAAVLRSGRQRRVRGRALGVAFGSAVVAFVSPLCALTVALFAARGVHHLVLMFALAPALAVVWPLRTGIWRAVTGTPALVALSAALWLWHVPPVYAAAWDSAGVYWGLQAALVLPAWAVWSGLLAAQSQDPTSRRDPGTHLAAQLAGGLRLGALAGQMGLIGAILTFAPHPLYPEHLAGTAAFGLSALGDQQLAGLVMWVPGMVPVAVASAWLLLRAWRLAEARGGVPG